MRHLRRHTSRHTSLRRATAACILLAAGLASPAIAQTKSWLDDGVGDWSVPGNWSPFGAPTGGDTAIIGNLLQAKQAVAHLDGNTWVAGLQVIDGCRLLTMNHQLIVSGNTTVAHEYDLGGTTQESRIYIRNAPEAIDFQTGDLTIDDKAWFFLEQGAVARINGTMLINPDSYAVGDGRYDLMANGNPALVNHGALYLHSSLMTLNQIGSGLIDLDGNGSGRVHVNPAFPGGLTINATALADSFSGVMYLSGPTTVFMNITSGWEADAQSEILAQGAITGGQRLITGADVILGGYIETRWSDTVLDFAADSTIRETVNAFVDGGTVLKFSGDTRVEGGTFLVEDGGYFIFEGATEWDGDVVIDGAASQLGDAVVTGPTHIRADLFNLDGGGPTSWTVNAPFVLDVDSIDDHFWERFDGTISVAGGFLPAITINYTDPNASWVMYGQMNLAGDSTVFSTKVGGSGFSMLGDLAITSGKVAITTDSVEFGGTSTTTFGAWSAALRLHGETTVQRGADFVGEGTIRNAPSGSLILGDGADFAQVNLVNDGVLVIGDEAPALGSAASIALNANSLWHVEIGGATARTEFDQMAVDGAAVMGGQLFVDLVDLGDGQFLPQIGDTFTIVSAGGLVSGTFAEDPISFAGGNLYHWTPIYGLHRVDLQITEILECLADFNRDGVINTLDVIAFLNAWASDDSSADLNQDGVTDTRDVLAFLSLWVAGC